MNKKFLRLPKVIDRTGFSRSSIYALMARNDFPHAYPLGGRAVAWLESDIDAWIDLRLKEGQKKRAA